MKRIHRIFSRLRKRNIVSIIINIALSLLVSMLLIAASGSNPFLALASLFTGAFGSGSKILETLINSIPLIGVGLAISVGFTGGVFNIGAEGQFLTGAFLCGLTGSLFPGLPGILYIPFLLLTGAFGGMICALFPAVVKVSRGVHEVITTIMMNYVALYLISYLVYAFFRVPGDMVAMEVLAPGALIPGIFPGGTSRISYGFIIMIALALIVYALLDRSVLGFEIRAVGMNKTSSLYSGVRIKRTMLVTFLFSGALAGLTGGLEIIGLHGRYYDGFAAGYGFAGIPIALLARKNPLGVIFAGIFMGALQNGALEMQIIAGVPRQIVVVIQGLIIVFVAGERAIPFVRESIINMKKRNGGLIQ